MAKEISIPPILPDNRLLKREDSLNELEELRSIAAKVKGWQVEATRILEDYLADKDTLTLHFDRMEALVTSIANADLGDSK